MINNPSVQGALKDAASAGVYHLVMEGAPVNGVAGSAVGIAGKGCLLTNTLTGQLFKNTGTPASPTWVELT